MRAAIGFLCMMLAAQSARAVEITSVSASPDVFDPARQEATSIRFRLSSPARVMLRVFDGRDFEVRSVSSGRRLSAGEHSLRWDGRDSRRRVVPSEAYRFTLEADAGSGEKVLWDLSDVSGGESLKPTAVRLDPDSGSIQYLMPEAGRVRIRLGLRNDGPLLRTLVDWVPRSSGPHGESWNGLDSAGVLDFGKHPSLQVLVEAFSLSRNTIIVGPGANKVELIQDLAPRRRLAAKDPALRRMHAYEAQPIEVRRDFPIELRLPETLERDPDGLPVVKERVPVRIEVGPELSRIANERFEAVYFLDGGFLFETETGFLPVTFGWDPAGVNPGIHYLTANLRGYEGHFGMVTIRVRVK